jgi:hypothetical protein
MGDSFRGVFDLLVLEQGENRILVFPLVQEVRRHLPDGGFLARGKRLLGRVGLDENSRTEFARHAQCLPYPIIYVQHNKVFNPTFHVQPSF